jgi:hypothetical protein
MSVCLICLNPNDIWFEFLSQFKNYDVYVVIDNNTINYNGCFKHYDKIHVIQIQEIECIKSGFIDMNFLIGKKISGWEKALYYFSNINTNYKNVWFLEDDVFLYDESTFSNIDSKYLDSDLLSSPYTEKNNKNFKNDWHWDKIDIKLPLPYYSAMVCSVRISSKLMSAIKNYADKNKTLFFLEALFPTICKYHKLKYGVPKELTTITWRKLHKNNEINKINIYHPLKNIKTHTLIRNNLK